MPSRPKNSFDQDRMLITRVVHVEANLLHDLGNIRTSECQVLKCARETTVLRRINNRISGFSGELGRGVH
jgi:hypothetical protein